MYFFPKKISEFMSLLEIGLVTVFMGLFLGFIFCFFFGFDGDLVAGFGFGFGVC